MKNGKKDPLKSWLVLFVCQALVPLGFFIIAWLDRSDARWHPVPNLTYARCFLYPLVLFSWIGYLACVRFYLDPIPREATGDWKWAFFQQRSVVSLALCTLAQAFNYVLFRSGGSSTEFLVVVFIGWGLQFGLILPRFLVYQRHQG